MRFVSKSRVDGIKTSNRKPGVQKREMLMKLMVEEEEERPTESQSKNKSPILQSMADNKYKDENNNIRDEKSKLKSEETISLCSYPKSPLEELQAFGGEDEERLNEIRVNRLLFLFLLFFPFFFTFCFYWI